MVIRTEEEIQTWILTYLSRLFDIPADDIGLKVPLERYGIDSTAAVGFTGDLGEWLGRDIEPGLVYDYPTVDAMTRHLAQAMSETA
ncbi:acyl carrier protein [Chitinivorax sp. B]|uniref:acyl carrier protein n=1 Tax=Chitinivorax sp. B TaxID=2502235 RepID=UPI0010F9C26B|nr:acyl carrier protein [Chitinivorax sp. B]